MLLHNEEKEGENLSAAAVEELDDLLDSLSVGSQGGTGGRKTGTLPTVIVGGLNSWEGLKFF